MMKNMKKLFQLTPLLILMAMFWCQPVLARTDFEIEVDPDADGICDSDFFPGPYYFCSPNADDEPDNCPGVANPDQADSDDDGVGDACDTPEDGGVDISDNADDTGDDIGVDPSENVNMPEEGAGCSLVTHGKARSAGPYFMTTLLLALLTLRHLGNRHAK